MTIDLGTPRQRAIWLARLRSLVGLKLMLFPRTAARLAVGPPTATTSAVLRMVGVRDVALGLGATAGAREGTQGPEWTGWAAVADGFDALALLCTPGLPRRARVTGLAAAAGAVVGMRIAWDLADVRAADAAPGGSKVPDSTARE